MEWWMILLYIFLPFSSSQACTPGDIRLQGGTDHSGRVEICFNNVWGRVCGNSWDSTDAKVACRQLRLPSSSASVLTTGSLNGFGQIWLSNVNCDGSESRLIYCTSSLGSSNCQVAAGVRCTGTTCTHGVIRLRGGSITSGRVEICYDNVWGTVCDHGWGSTDARVACRQLGLPSTSAAALTSGFSIGTGHIWIRNVSCVGTESELLGCAAYLAGNRCSHVEDAGVRCTGTISCTQGAIRLQGGTATSGRVEICHNNVWGTVCDDLWSSVDARVACRQLGLPSTSATFINSGFTMGSDPIWLDDVSCRGTESRLIDCPASPIGQHSCDHSEDAGVRCTGTTCTRGAIRLQGGTTTSGRVEICYKNVWGTVCDNFWGGIDARVACRQLGLPSSSATALTSGFSNGLGHIWFGNLRCTGTESRLIDCILSFGSCSHIQDAGVSCTGTTCTEGDIRLQGGTATSGRVEICHNNAWGTVCDDRWGSADARVACRQLGLPYTGAIPATSNSGFTIGAGPIWLDDVNCQGTESRLIYCITRSIGQHNCDHTKDAGVRCQGPAMTCTEGAIRLRGSTATSGRVEICHSNAWGTVCDDLWSSVDARVACRQLGFPSTGATSITLGFTNGIGQIWLDNVQCLGTESRLINCPASPLGLHDCVHAEDAGVRCQGTATTCSQGAIRLQGGTATSGRVEICNNNAWGTVCDNLWDNADARVACRQLGLPSTGATSITSGFTNGVGQIWLDDVQCLGTESRLLDCTRSNLGSSNCGHSEDAGVICTVEGISTDSADSTDTSGSSFSDIPIYVWAIVASGVGGGIITIIITAGTILYIRKIRKMRRFQPRESGSVRFVNPHDDTTHYFK